MSRQIGETFVLTITALPSNVPTIIRLRALLKAALRIHRFRCVAIKPANQPQNQAAASPIAVAPPIAAPAVDQH